MSSNVGYIQFPTGSLRYNDSDYYQWEITRINPSGIRVQSYQDTDPNSWGIFTCQLPDSNGNTIEPVFTVAEKAHLLPLRKLRMEVYSGTLKWKSVIERA